MHISVVEVRHAITVLRLQSPAPPEWAAGGAVAGALLSWGGRRRPRLVRWLLIACAGVGFLVAPPLGWAGFALSPAAWAARWRRRAMVWLLAWVPALAAWWWAHPASAPRAGESEMAAGIAGAIVLVSALGFWSARHLRIAGTPPRDIQRFATPEQAREVLGAWHNCCAVCGARGDAPGVQLEMDHIVPHALGGPTTIANLQPLCGPCNRAKGKLSMHEFTKTAYWRQLAG